MQPCKTEATFPEMGAKELEQNEEGQRQSVEDNRA